MTTLRDLPADNVMRVAIANHPTATVKIYEAAARGGIVPIAIEAERDDAIAALGVEIANLRDCRRLGRKGAARLKVADPCFGRAQLVGRRAARGTDKLKRCGGAAVEFCH
ncbi:MAG TPA: hypothetical protein PLX84_03000 [Acidiphilium sp.]|nr:hypothetical protein [Acidiphilium sp.]